MWDTSYLSVEKYLQHILSPVDVSIFASPIQLNLFVASASRSPVAAGHEPLAARFFSGSWYCPPIAKSAKAYFLVSVRPHSCILLSGSVDGPTRMSTSMFND